MACGLRLVIASAVLWTAATSNCFSEENVLDRFEAHVFKSSTGTELPYRQLAPKEIKDGEKYPLVIFLHGAGERGDDNKAQLVHGMSDFASDKIMEKYPAFVIAPQCPAGQKWVDVDWSADSHEMPEKPSPSMAALIEMIEQTTAKFPVDKSRIYVTGLSMGGYGSWDLLARHPEWFAGAVVICGGGDSREETVSRIKDIPVWVVHGDADNAVKVERSRAMVDALKKVGSKPKYTEMKGVGHNSWTATYSNPETYSWLFGQQKKNKNLESFRN